MKLRLYFSFAPLLRPFNSGIKQGKLSLFKRSNGIKGLLEPEPISALDPSIKHFFRFSQDVKSSFRQRGSRFLIHGGFDVVYSVLVLFHRDLPTEMKHSTFEILNQSMGDVLRTTDQFINSSENEIDYQTMLHSLFHRRAPIGNNNLSK